MFIINCSCEQVISRLKRLVLQAITPIEISLSAPTITKGKVKCKLEKRFNVGLSTAKPPHEIFQTSKNKSKTINTKKQYYKNIKKLKYNIIFD